MNRQNDNLLDSLNWDIEPERDLWPEISAKLEKQTSATAIQAPIDETPLASNGAQVSTLHRWMPAAMAACLMIAVGSMWLSYYSMNRNSEYMELQATLLMQHQETIRAIEAQHQEVKTRLVALLENEADVLDPILVSEAQSILDTTESASAEIKRAIENAPNKQAYLNMLVKTYQRETDLLKRIKLGQELSI